MLNAWPNTSEPIVETTGMRSSASSRSMIVGVDADHVADEPELGASAASASDEPGVLARQAHGERTVHVQRASRCRC